MLELEPPRHTRLRGLVLRAFTSRRIRAMAPEITALCHQLIDAFPEGGLDLLPAYAQRVPVIVIARLLGVPEDMADRAARLVERDGGHVSGPPHPRDGGRRRNRRGRILGLPAHYIDARRARPADDLITHLIAAEAEGERLSTDELITTCILLLNAGHEATVHTIGNGVKALLEARTPPDALAPDRIEATVEEILRFDPPLHLFTRHVYEEVEIFGHRLPARRPGGLPARGGEPRPGRLGGARALRPRAAPS
jgi:cytochrome P450